MGYPEVMLRNTLFNYAGQKSASGKLEIPAATGYTGRNAGRQLSPDTNRCLDFLGRAEVYLDTLLANGTSTTYEEFSGTFRAFRRLGNAYWPQIGPIKLPREWFGNRLLFDGNNQAFSSVGSASATNGTPVTLATPTPNKSRNNFRRLQ
jgi:hypothetical protein